MSNLQWLVEKGGAAIKLNLMNEGLINKDIFDEEKLVDELMQVEKIKTALTYFDKFKNYKSMRPAPYNDLLGFIHNCYEDCYEMFMRFFINIGFRKGIPVFDEKVKYMREVYQYLMANDMYHWNIVIMLMMDTGYYYDDMLDGANRFLNKIHETAKRKCFDIYETDPSKIRHTKLPKIWKDALIMKDIHVSKEDELPLPNIYDIWYILGIYKFTDDESIKRKIDDIIEYILHPEYQKLQGDYGYGWCNGKAYYALTPGVTLPLYEGNGFSINTFDLISRSPVAAKSKWYRDCIGYLEQFRTERDTYILPEDWFWNTFTRPASKSVIYEAFISKDAKVKRNEKSMIAIELLSTYFVMLMKKRMERTE